MPRGRPKGQPKTGGRKKGFPFYKNGMPVDQLLDELKHNPIRSLVAIAENKETPPGLAAFCEAKLARFCHAEAVKHIGAGENGEILFKKRLIGVSLDEI